MSPIDFKLFVLPVKLQLGAHFISVPVAVASEYVGASQIV